MDSLHLRTTIGICIGLLLLVGCGPAPAVTTIVVTATASDAESLPPTATARPGGETGDTSDGFPPPGIISGGLCFPSDYIPPMTIYARNVDTQQTFSIHVPVDTAEYQIEIPVEGTYVVFAWTDSGMGGSYSRFVTCGLSVECSDHTLIPIPVKSGETVGGVDICDFYSEEDVPQP